MSTLKKISFLTTVVAVLSFSAVSSADPFYVWVNGVEGGCTRAGLEGSIVGVEFTHQGTTELDYNVSSGSGSGTPHHGFVKVTLEMDRAYPMLIRNWAEVRRIQDVMFEFHSIDDTGTEVVEQRISLGYVRIASFKMHQGAEGASNENSLFEVVFEYGNIEWEWQGNGGSIIYSTTNTRH